MSACGSPCHNPKRSGFTAESTRPKQAALSNPTAANIQQAAELGLAYVRALRSVDPAPLSGCEPACKAWPTARPKTSAACWGQVQSGKDALRAIYTHGAGRHQALPDIKQTITAPLKEGAARAG